MTAADTFPPAGYTDGHSRGQGGAPDGPDAYLERIHAQLLAVARDGDRYLIVQHARKGLPPFLRAKGYRVEWLHVPGLPFPLLNVTW